MQRFEGEVVDLKVWKCKFEYASFWIPKLFSGSRHKQWIRSSTMKKSSTNVSQKQTRATFLVCETGNIRYKNAHNSPKMEIWNFSYTISADAISIQTFYQLDLPFCNTSTFLWIIISSLSLLTTKTWDFLQSWKNTSSLPN